jgi:hypothetical protein
MDKMDNKKSPNLINNFFCEKCNYKTCNKKDFNKHLLTQKHKNKDNDNNYQKSHFYVCEKCNKSYLYLSGLSRHKKKCNFVELNNNENGIIALEKNDISNNELILSNDAIIKLINDNNELKNIIVKQQAQLGKQQEQISELIPKVGNNNNTQNNKFNIQVFLNEKCKDAINMTDFVKSIQVSIEQLDFTKNNGLANGLSKTIMDNMNKLSLYERPMHCTDVKRETLYIKDENEWTKDASKEKIKKAIKKASGKNYNALQDWKTENPDFLINDSKTDYFTKTITTIGKPTETIDTKVIKNLCKETYIKDNIE